MYNTHTSQYDNDDVGQSPKAIIINLPFSLRVPQFHPPSARTRDRHYHDARTLSVVNGPSIPDIIYFIYTVSSDTVRILCTNGYSSAQRLCRRDGRIFLYFHFRRAVRRRRDTCAANTNATGGAVQSFRVLPNRGRIPFRTSLGTFEYA